MTTLTRPCAPPHHYEQSADPTPERLNAYIEAHLQEAKRCLDFTPLPWLAFIAHIEALDLLLAVEEPWMESFNLDPVAAAYNRSVHRERILTFIAQHSHRWSPASLELSEDKRAIVQESIASLMENFTPSEDDGLL